MQVGWNFFYSALKDLSVNVKEMLTTELWNRWPAKNSLNLLALQKLTERGKEQFDNGIIDLTTALETAGVSGIRPPQDLTLQIFDWKSRFSDLSTESKGHIDTHMVVYKDSIVFESEC